MRKSSPFIKSNKVGSSSRQSVRSIPSRVASNSARSRAASVAVAPSNNRFSRSRAGRKPSGVISALSLNNLGPDGNRKLTGRKIDDVRTKVKCQAIQYFWHDFTTILFSPLFLRHRNLLFFFMEIIAPAVVALIIFAAFTSGISWKQKQFYKFASKGRTIDFPDTSMSDATTNFRTLHTDANNQVLIYFTPVNDFTSTIMQSTLDICGLRDTNIVFKHGDASTGAVGVKNQNQLKERALFHRMDRLNHGIPIGVIFDYDPNLKSEVTGIPYNITYTISNFDSSISKTGDLHPFVPPATSPNWKTPYLTSGFIGIQYAIEESIIRLIIEKQKEQEIKQIKENAAAKTRSLIEGDDINLHESLTSDDIDADKVFFLIKETLEEIRLEKERREELDDLGVPYDPNDLHSIDGDEEEGQGQSQDTGKGSGAVGRSLGSGSGSGTGTGRSKKIRPISAPTELPARFLQAFVSDQTGTPEFRDLVSYVVTFSLVVAYSFMSFFIVRQIAKENKSGIKELLQIHGLPHYIHWTMLFVHALVFRAVTSALVLLTLRIDYGNGKIAEVSTADVLYVLIYIHQLSLTFMNYFIGMYIRSTKLCGLIAVSSCVLSFYLPEAFSGMKLIGGLTDFIVAIIFPNWCFRHAMRCLLDHESNEKSIGWDNLFESEYASNKITVGDGMLRLSFMGIIYFFLAVYIGMNGTLNCFSNPKKWRNIKDWIKKKRRQSRHDSTTSSRRHIIEDQGDEDPDFDFPKPQVYEDPHPDKDCYVYVRNLCKNYGHHKVALDSLNINIMHDEITVFLGHSGCGKTTLISILAGMLQPSNGNASIKGFDVSSQSDKARQFIGVCPQRLVAFNLLTVREHVHLCYRLRGYKNKECNRYAASILTQLKLWNVRSSLPSNLTNDELRRLGIAMCMVDAPKIMMFDEPTRGMDAMGRREIWDIILSMRHHHTIIVTTNYMDEAEHIADRLALLAHGRLVCCGSIDYLKSQYDTGYFLKLIPYPEKFIDANAVINFVRSILGVKVQMKKHKRLKDVDTLELELPTREKDHFADFCEELDAKIHELHIMKYSIRQVNLNDIFIKICSSVAADGYAVDMYVRRDSAGDIKTVLTSEIPEIPEGIKKNTSRFHHFMALLKRSWTVGKTAKRTVFLHFIVPLIIIFIVVFQAKLFVQSKEENPAMSMKTSRFGPNLRIFSQINDDDPSINYRRHISRVLNPYEVPLEKNDRVLPKLYDALSDANPGDIGYIKERHIIAYELNRKGRNLQFTGYYSTGQLHSAPLALNLMNNALLSAISEPERPFTKNWRQYQVNLINKPLPQVEDGQFEKGCGIACILLALLMSFAMAFISHSVCKLPLEEKVNGMKHLIFMSGIEPTDYWLSNFIIDFFNMFLMTVIIVFIFISDLYGTFYSTEVIFAMWIIAVLYLMWGGLFYCYYLSSIMHKKLNGYNFLAILHLFLGVVPFLWLTIARPDSWVGILTKWALLLFLPPYTITSALYHFFSGSGRRSICKNIHPFLEWVCDPIRQEDPETYIKFDDPLTKKLWIEAHQVSDPKFARCCPRTCRSVEGSKDVCFHPPKVFNFNTESWEDPGIITDVVILFLQGFIFWLFLIIAERKIFQRFGHNLVTKFLNPGGRKSSVLSSDHRHSTSSEGKKFREVFHERLMVDSIIKEDLWPEDVAMVLQNLTKSSSSTMLIKDFNLVVKRGQCIAILGRGNSGKSCVLRMIAGEETPTDGNVYMQNCNLLLNRKQYLSKLGYCPQKSSLFPYFTGSQMMELMGRLRGVPSSILSTHVNKWLSVMGLGDVANDKCEEYGDGLRQRLCTAMALIGEPEIILLDEPTSGVDPSARERLWCAIEHLAELGFTIIFTTYSTDEAFSLADKVVVLSEGSIQCIGAPEEVRNKYAKGFTITFKLRHDVMSSAELISQTELKVLEFKDRVSDIYKHIDLLDEHDEMIMFFLRDARLSWAEVFRRGHYLASVHDEIIESYEVTEGGVDDIFVFLTNKFHELSKPRHNDPPPEQFFQKRKSKDNKEIDELEELKQRKEEYKRTQILT